MIIVKIMGGLGNQMFQYAFGKCLANKNKTGLLLDKSEFDNPRQERKYELDKFCIDITKDRDLKIERIINLKNPIYGIAIWQKIKRNWLKLYGYEYYKEQSCEFDSKILDLPDKTFIEGYWQSEKYFENIKEEIRRSFSTFKPPLSKRTQLIAKKEQSVNSISIHVRRGDYISNKNANDTHGSCSLDYYHRAIKLISQKVKDPVFFMFSDDIVWTKKNLKLNFPCHYVDHNDSGKDYEDIYLMSQCKHHIIANSTFSWWGAWLGKDKNNVTIGPKKWFKAKDITKVNIMPEHWIKI